MSESLYLVECFQYKSFSYILTTPTVEGGFYFNLKDAKEAMLKIPPRKGLWVLISQVPLETLYPENFKQPLGLFEYQMETSNYRSCDFPQTAVERLIFRTLKLTV